MARGLGPVLGYALVGICFGCSARGHSQPSGPSESAAASASGLPSQGQDTFRRQVASARDKALLGYDAWGRGDFEAARRTWRDGRAELERAGIRVKLRPGPVLWGKNYRMTAVAFECGFGVVGFEDGHVETWDPRGFRRERFDLAGAEVTDLACDPVHHVIYATDVNGLLKRWDLKNGRESLKLELPQPSTLSLSESGNRILLTNGEGLMALNPQTSAIEKIPIPPSVDDHRPARGVQFLRGDDDLLVLFTNSGMARWSIGSPAPAWKIQADRLGGVRTNVGIGIIAASTGVDRTAWDLETGAVRGLPGDKRNSYFALAPREPYLAELGRYAEEVEVIDVRTGQQVARLPVGPFAQDAPTGLPAIGWSADGRLLSLHFEGRFQSWDTTTWHEVGEMTVSHALFKQILISSNGESLVGFTLGGQFWNVPFGAGRAGSRVPFQLADFTELRGLVGPDPGRIVVSSSRNYELVNVSSAEIEPVPKPSGTDAIDFAVGEGQRLLSAHLGTLGIFEIDGEEKPVARQHVGLHPKEGARCAAMQRRSGGSVVAAFLDGSVVLVTPGTPPKTRKWLGLGDVYHVAISEAGENPTIAAGTERGVFVWNAQDKKVPEPRFVPQEVGILWGFDLSPDGRCVVLATRDAVLGCVPGGKQTGGAREVRFIGERAVAVLGTEGAVRFYDTGDGETGKGASLLLLVEIRADGEWVASTPDGQVDASSGERPHLVGVAEGPGGPETIVPPMLAWDDLKEGLVKRTVESARAHSER